MQLDEIKNKLSQEIATSHAPRTVLKSSELRDLYSQIPSLPPEERGQAGRQINQLKNDLEKAVEAREAELEAVSLDPIDV